MQTRWEGLVRVERIHFAILESKSSILEEVATHVSLRWVVFRYSFVESKFTFFGTWVNEFGQEISQNRRVECWKRDGIEWDVYLKEVCLADRLLRSFCARNARKTIKWKSNKTNFQTHIFFSCSRFDLWFANAVNRS